VVDEQAGADLPSRRIAVLVSGSGTNLEALDGAIAGDPSFGGRIVVVASDRPDCGGIQRARSAGTPTVASAIGDHPDRGSWERHLLVRLERHTPEIVVLAGFMRILSADFVARWPHRIVNVHPSLLPAFPGADAVRQALVHGVKVTGSTIHLVDEQVDHGPIVAQRALRIVEDDDEESLHARLRAIEHELLPAVVKALCHDRLVVEGRHVHLVPAADAAGLTIFDAEDSSRSSR
jgi:phosphoribosylglycinamide formyltransferase 1